MPARSASGAKGAARKTAAAKTRRTAPAKSPSASSSPSPARPARKASTTASASRPRTKAASPKTASKPAPKTARASTRRPSAQAKSSRTRRGSRTPKPAAMEVSYSGRVFRSRLEARWAVFLDVLGVNWDYEPCFYDVAPVGAAEGLFYLPDFYLPDLRLWLEVKGAPFMDAASMAKCLAAVAGPSPVPLREAPYTPSDRLLLGGPFRPLVPGTRPTHTLIAPAGERTAALSSAVFGLGPGGAAVLEPAGPPWDTVPATGVKAARRPTPARLERLLEPGTVPGTADQTVARAYLAAYTLAFDDAARRVAVPSDPGLREALAGRRSGRPLGTAHPLLAAA